MQGIQKIFGKNNKKIIKKKKPKKIINNPLVWVCSI